MLPFSAYVSLRYLRAKRRQAFISIISFISISGVALGVGALIVVLAVMNGFDRDLRNKILGTRSHLTIGASSGHIDDVSGVLNKVNSDPRVVAACPYVTEQVMLRGKDGVSGAVLFGQDFSALAKITDIPKFIVLGRIPSDSPVNKQAMVLGVDLAYKLGVSVGDEVTVVTPRMIQTAAGTIPRMAKYRVGAIFDAGMYEYNSTFAYMPLVPMQVLLKMEGQVHGIEIKVSDIYKARQIGRELVKNIGGGLWAMDWISMNRNLFSALALEKMVMFLILAIIILVAAFNILSTLIMVVTEKTREIGILKALGATTGQIMWIFMLDGILIGVVGTVVGLVLGIGICLAQEKYQFVKLPGDVYYITTLPIYMKTSDVVLVLCSALALSFLATLYPAWQAARLDPVEAIRYE